MTWYIENNDALVWLGGLPTGSVDLVVTDYAYESLEKYRAIGTTTRLTEAWFPIFKNDRVPELMCQLYRVMVTNSHLYMYCDEETRDVIKPAGEAAGFKYWKALIWEKLSMGMGYHYRAQHEFICFFEKGKRNLNSRGIGDVFSVKSVRNKYPTEKPEDVSRILIENSSNPGELVIDPFCGSGSVGSAALSCGRSFYGCDVLEDTVELAEDRLNDAYPNQHGTPKLKGQTVMQFQPAPTAE